MARESVSDGLNSTQLLYSLLLIAVFLVGYLFARVQAMDANKGLAAAGTGAVAGAQAGTQGAPAAPVIADVKNGHLPVEGSEDAKVTIVEFSDFQCPFCEQFYTQTLGQLRKDYVETGKVKIYFRHYPLPFHQAALPAGIASECANDQGKFWEFHDKVFSEQTKISAGTVDENKGQLKQWAADLGLDTSKFNQCLDSEQHKDAVTTDQTDGNTAGVSGTPSFYINGTQLVGAQPYTAFKALIDQELAKN